MPNLYGNQLLDDDQIYLKLTDTTPLNSSTFTSVAGQSVFAFDYVRGLVDVKLNGNRLKRSAYTATNGTSVTLATPIASNYDVLTIDGFMIEGSQNAAGNFLAYGGTANAITLTSNNAQPAKSYKDGAQYKFRATATNTGSATISVDGLPAKACKTITGTALASGHIRTDMQSVATYYETGDSFVVFSEAEDAVLRQDLANPNKGAALVARGVVAVDNIADLLALPAGQRREDLRYLVKGFHAPQNYLNRPYSGGGEFCWEPTRPKTDHNGGTVIDPDKSFPDFYLGTGVTAWFQPAVSGNGCFVSVYNGLPSVEWFGAAEWLPNSLPSLQAATDAHKEVRAPGRYRGDGPWVIRNLSKIFGVTKEISGYYNATGAAATGIGVVTSPEGSGVVDYDVSADLIVVNPEDKYAVYVECSNLFFGDYTRANAPQYSVFAPLLAFAAFSHVRMEGATDSVYMSLVAFSSFYTSCAAIARHAAGDADYSWRFGKREMDVQVLVGMTSNVFLTCSGLSAATANWYVRRGTYSTFSACYGEGSGGAFYFIDPASTTLSGCGDEQQTDFAIKVKSTQTLENRSSITVNGYDIFSSTYINPPIDIDGLVNVTLDNVSIQSAGNVEMRTVNGARVTVIGTIPLPFSTADSNAPVNFVGREVYREKVGFDLGFYDEVLFDENGARYCMVMDASVSMTAKNAGVAAERLQCVVRKNSTILTPYGLATVAAGDWGCVNVSSRIKVVRGDEVTVAPSDLAGNFAFTGGEGGVVAILRTTSNADGSA